MKKISILGKGIFGLALASYLSKKHEVIFDEISNSDFIFVCVSSHIFSETLLKFKPEIKKQKIIICTKGFTAENQLISDFLTENFSNQIFFLYGPTLANELEQGEISGMVLAGGENKEEIKKEIESDIFKIDLSDDIIGVQIGGALKNVIIIFTGIAQGANYGQNTQAFILTKGLAEIQKIGVSLGAKVETFLGLSCVGDLNLNSRNRKLGIEIGKGKSVNQFIQEYNYIPEGINAIKNIKEIAKLNKIEIPFILLLDSILFQNYSIKEAIKKIN